VLSQDLEEAKAFFGEMAARYGKYPNIIYEVYNEPAGPGWPEVKACAEADRDQPGFGTLLYYGGH